MKYISIPESVIPVDEDQDEFESSLGIITAEADSHFFEILAKHDVFTDAAVEILSQYPAFAIYMMFHYMESRFKSVLVSTKVMIDSAKLIHGELPTIDKIVAGLRKSFLELKEREELELPEGFTLERLDASNERLIRSVLKMMEE